MRDEPTSDPPPGWKPLKGRPYHHDEELHLTRVSGNFREFENHAGSRYRCVIEEDGTKQWFTLRTNRRMQRATRASVKTCCKKFQLGFGTFIDRMNSAGPVSIFPKGRGLATRRSSQIDFCPWCGQKIRFVGESEETGGPQVRTASAGG